MLHDMEQRLKKNQMRLMVGIMNEYNYMENYKILANSKLFNKIENLFYFFVMF